MQTIPPRFPDRTNHGDLSIELIEKAQPVQTAGLKSLEQTFAVKWNLSKKRLAESFQFATLINRSPVDFGEKLWSFQVEAVSKMRVHAVGLSGYNQVEISEPVQLWR